MYQTLYEFVQGIDSNNLPNEVSHHFDQVVGLYHLIGGRSDVDVCTTNARGKFGFSILLEREEDAKHLSAILSNNTISVFDKNYVISSNRRSDSVNVFFVNA